MGHRGDNCTNLTKLLQVSGEIESESALSEGTWGADVKSMCTHIKTHTHSRV